jgi:hypothetical protein
VTAGALSFLFFESIEPGEMTNTEDIKKHVLAGWLDRWVGGCMYARMYG